jgi:aminoglycoside phosphotransferase (APT) family kinase protein
MDHRALIATRCPFLAVGTCEPVGDGWTCDTYLVDGAWIAQVPRSPYASERLRTQLTVLPELASELSTAVPEPEPSVIDGDPPLLVYRRIEGAACDDAPDGIWPERLGRLLYDLHSVPPEFLGLRSMGPGAIREDRPRAWGELADVVLPLLGPAERERARAMLGAALADDDMWTFAPVVTHGDLGPEHVLVDEAGDLAGVIDWEEVSIEDPAGDLAWWLHAMPEVGERALAAYGGAPDRRFRERARILFALMPWHEVRYGVEGGGEAFVASGLAGVRERLA